MPEEAEERSRRSSASSFAMWWLIVDPLPRARLRPNGERLVRRFVAELVAIVGVPLVEVREAGEPGERKADDQLVRHDGRQQIGDGPETVR